MPGLSVNLSFKGHWILERLATELAAIPGVELNPSGWPPTKHTAHDVMYFLPGRNIRHMSPRPTNRIKIGYFTHGDAHPRQYQGEFDVCLAMNKRMARLLVAAGARDVRVIRPGTDPGGRPIVFGVNCRSVESLGRRSKPRKGLDIVQRAVRDGYHFVGCTPDPPAQWPCPVTHRSDSASEREAFYASIDYLVVTSRDEGGPMVVPEAIAHGVPVIAPNVGWCWEFPVIRYEDEYNGLSKVLRGLTAVPTWGSWVEQHRRLFDELAERAA